MIQDCLKVYNTSIPDASDSPPDNNGLLMASLPYTISNASLILLLKRIHLFQKSHIKFLCCMADVSDRGITERWSEGHKIRWRSYYKQQHQGVPVAKDWGRLYSGELKTAFIEERKRNNKAPEKYTILIKQEREEMFNRRAFDMAPTWYLVEYYDELFKDALIAGHLEKFEIFKDHFCIYSTKNRNQFFAMLSEDYLRISYTPELLL